MTFMFGAKIDLVKFWRIKLYSLADNLALPLLAYKVIKFDS